MVALESHELQRALIQVRPQIKRTSLTGYAANSRDRLRLASLSAE